MPDRSQRPRRLTAGGLAIAALALSPVLAACSSPDPGQAPSATTAPSVGPSEGPSTTDPSSAPSSGTAGPTSVTPADPADTIAAAAASAAAYLKDSGYEVTGTTANAVTYVGDGPVTVTFSCGGGATHDVGWVGLCSGTGKNALPMVAPTRVVAGPKAESVAMLRDDAAYCGGDGTPAWAKKFLKSASKEFCYLKEDEG